MAYTVFDDPASVFDTKLYTGTGSELTVTGIGFQPDFTWLKDRSAVQHHQVYDSVRGAGEVIYPNLDNGEGTVTQQLKSWTSDGYVIGTDGSVNTSTNNYASWNFKAGTTSGITGGTITPSSYSINADAGIGMYAYTGTGANGTIAHGLSSAPKFIMVKRLNVAGNWMCGGSIVGTGLSYNNLNNTGIAYDNATVWNSTLPSSTVISIGTYGASNTSLSTYMLYAFAPVKGYSKFGIYYGTANASGPVIDLGFRPAFVLIKPVNYTSAWNITDNRRPGYQPVAASNLSLNPNTSASTITEARMQLMSNGFKLNTTAGEVNQAYTYMYMAFAESPIANSSGTANNAR